MALFRIFASLFLLLFMLPSAGVYEFLGSLPDDFYLPPPGPMMLFDGFPSVTIFRILHGLLIVALLFLLVGFKTKMISILTGILLLCINGFVYSLGKIDHDILIAVVPFVMAFSSWEQAYSVDSYNKQASEYNAQSWTLVLLALILGFMMFTAGFPKILGGWLDIQTQAAEGHFFKQYFVRGRQDLLAAWALNISNNVWEILDYATVFLEVGFLAAILKPQSTRIFICLAVLFHFCTMMILNIAFLPNFLVYAAFLNWDWINQSLKKYKSNLAPIILSGLMVIVYGVIQMLENFVTFRSDLTMAAVCLVSIGMIIAIYHLSKQMVQWSKRRLKSGGAQ